MMSPPERYGQGPPQTATNWGGNEQQSEKIADLAVVKRLIAPD
jgi:hypothetical protein